MRSDRDGEHRRAPRHRKSGAILFRTRAADEFQSGWLLEASETGMAFAWRGRSAPPVNAIIEVGDAHPSAEKTASRAVVRRVNVAHNDLCVIAVELINLRPFPLAAKATVDRALELKPPVITTSRLQRAA